MLGRLLTASIAIATTVLATPAPLAAADPPRLRTLDDHFPFTPPESLEAWKPRAEQVRHQIRVACGVWPRPELSPAAPWIGSETVFSEAGDTPGYSVAPITIEGLPGLMVTGSLYRPYPPRSEPGPGVLCPHGHWPEGRFHDAGVPAARGHIANGGERFMAAARSPIQARCVQLARMGCTVLLYDMLGYADSSQISFDRAHRFARQTADENQPDADGWLLFSPLAESHLQSPMALQTIHTFAALEALSELSEVDPKRMAITGASGGGTQSFIAAAIEPRIAAAFPAVMVSTGMQGGCTCENACLLRDGTGNVEIAAAIAPRPLGLTAADDWTRTMPEDGFPELKKLYGLFDAAAAVELNPAVHFKHNYNHVSRTAMYGFINRHFALGLQNPVLESDFQRLDKDELTVWSDSHPEPPGGLQFERQLLRKWAEQIQQRLQGAVDAADKDGGAEFEQLVAAGWDSLLGPHPRNISLAEESVNETPEAGGIRATARVRFDDSRNVMLDSRRTSKTVEGILLVAHPRGARLLDPPDADADADEQVVRDGMAAAITAGWAVVFADLEGASEDRQPLVREDRLAAAFTYGYNPPRVVRQARQLAAAAEGLDQVVKAWDEARGDEELPIRLVGCGSMAAAAAIARAIAPERFEGCVLQTDGFRFADCEAIDDSQFLPGGARYLDMPGLLALPSSGWLTVLGETSETMQVAKQISEARSKTAKHQEPPFRILAEATVPQVWQEAVAK